MTAKKITIRMPKKKLKLWLAALRLPANQKLQGTGALYTRKLPKYTDGKTGYCCLGVLQCVVTGGKVAGGAFPKEQWLAEEGIEFFDQDGSSTNNPYFPRFRCDASDANDEKRKSFKQIAQAIESCAVGY